MDKLPHELVEQILYHCFWQGDRNSILQLRLVCRIFDQLLKRHACQTVSLNFSRLNKASVRRRPAIDDLQTIGKNCKALNIDLMSVRDETELMTISEVATEHDEFELVPYLLRRHTTGSHTFTWPEYRSLLDNVLLTCDRIEALRLSLPMPILRVVSYEPTRTFANTMAAFSSRLDDEGALPLRTLVIENLDDIVIRNIWGNPIDISNTAKVMSHLRNLVIVFRVASYLCVERDGDIFLDSFRGLIGSATQLESLCVHGLMQPHTPRSLVVNFDDSVVDEPESDDEFEHGGLLAINMSSHLTRLELSKLELPRRAFRFIAKSFGPTLQELYLSELYLWVQVEAFAEQRTNSLWIGLPNERPEPGDTWVATLFRESCPNLKICRAAFLGYHITGDDPDGGDLPTFDLRDPSRLGRSIAQRFVEVVLGYAQPDAPPDPDPAVSPPSDTEPRSRAVQHLPYKSSDDPRFLAPENLRPRPAGSLRVEDHDLNAYRSVAHNTTSPWLQSIDAVFRPQGRSESRRDLEALIRLVDDAVNDHASSIEIGAHGVFTQEEIDDPMRGLVPFDDLLSEDLVNNEPDAWFDYGPGRPYTIAGLP